MPPSGSADPLDEPLDSAKIVRLLEQTGDTDLVQTETRSLFISPVLVPFSR